MKLEKPLIYNYCIVFIDLLGQRDEYKDEGLIPNFASAQEREDFNQKIEKTIIPIFELQKDVESIMKTALKPNPEYKNILPPDLYKSYISMRKHNIKTQRWSDGLVFFTSLGDLNIECPLMGIFGLFRFAGILCFMELVRKHPIRGAIDIAWGVELYDGELYGAAVAKAYELESQVAQYPRIIVSQRTIGFLKAHLQNISNDIYSRCNKQFTEMCLNMIVEDSDGYFIIHYLGNSFREYISKKLHDEMYKKAIKFVQGEFEKYRGIKDTKLAFRYSQLLSYFVAHPA